jgi:hypothetical protein
MEGPITAGCFGPLVAAAGAVRAGGAIAVGAALAIGWPCGWPCCLIGSPAGLIDSPAGLIGPPVGLKVAGSSFLLFHTWVFPSC